MYLVVLHAQAASFTPSASGAPTECSAFTKSRSLPSALSASIPMRAMIRIEATTYALSVICTPNMGCTEFSGPMQNGMTYIVRPRIDPL
ncbi:unannotated protein [freshwater metagenome]|uniref:Unannotated protein n=1 Tax=freshwater metagenome TaxID=449393 RepID=A0A6J6QHU5_9ZZZZ